MPGCVFLIRKPKYCDMEGADSFIDQYGAPGILRCAEAFERVGASAIGASLRSIAASLPGRDEALLTRANDLITGRAGYDFEAIRRTVVAQVT